MINSHLPHNRFGHTHAPEEVRNCIPDSPASDLSQSLTLEPITRQTLTFHLFLGSSNHIVKDVECPLIPGLANCPRLFQEIWCGGVKGFGVNSGLQLTAQEVSSKNLTTNPRQLLQVSPGLRRLPGKLQGTQELAELASASDSCACAGQLISDELFKDKGRGLGQDSASKGDKGHMIASAKLALTLSQHSAIKMKKINLICSPDIS